jgi:hypothetical protein
MTNKELGILITGAVCATLLGAFLLWRASAQDRNDFEISECVYRTAQADMYAGDAWESYQTYFEYCARTMK